jgi:hypothetical protein
VCESAGGGETSAIGARLPGPLEIACGNGKREALEECDDGRYVLYISLLCFTCFT